MAASDGGDSALRAWRKASPAAAAVRGRLGGISNENGEEPAVLRAWRATHNGYKARGVISDQYGTCAEIGPHHGWRSSLGFSGGTEMLNWVPRTAKCSIPPERQRYAAGHGDLPCLPHSIQKTNSSSRKQYPQQD